MPWLSYLPVPGLPFIAVWAAPEDPLTRYHAWQGGALVGLAYAALLVFSMLGLISDATPFVMTVGFLVSLTALAALTGMVWGIIAAVRGRYARIRPVWDLLAATRD